MSACSAFELFHRLEVGRGLDAGFGQQRAEVGERGRVGPAHVTSGSGDRIAASARIGWTAAASR